MNHVDSFVVSECVAYFNIGPFRQKRICAHRDGACKLYGDTPPRCRYLEEAVLPLDETKPGQRSSPEAPKAMSPVPAR